MDEKERGRCIDTFTINKNALEKLTGRGSEGETRFGSGYVRWIYSLIHSLV